MLRTFWSESLKERVHLEDPDVDGRIILNWILEKQSRKEWTGFIYLRTATTAGIL
jgi:hypothetical protein